jgi:hypothetical protein
VDWLTFLIGLVVPTGLGLLAAWPLWRWRQWAIGNAVGAGVVFVAVIFLIGSAYVTQQRENEACAAGLIRCVSRVDAHMPFLTYAVIAMIDACVLFWCGLKAEERGAPKTWQKS